MVRATKLTPEVESVILEEVAKGNTYKNAAAVAGIDETTFHRWMAQGESGRAPYRQFRQSVMRANAKIASTAVGNWVRLMQDDWRANRDFLRYRFADEWKSTERREHTGADGGPIGLAVLDDIMEGEEEE